MRPFPRYPLSTQFTLIKRRKSTWSLEEQILHRTKIPTYHFQKSLPRLPIPELEKTCDRYVSALKPLLLPETFGRTETAVSKFLHGEGKALNEELKAIDRRNKHTSYISDPWFEMYLKSRDPVVLNYNPFITFVPDPRPEYNNQLIRASNMLISSLRFMKTLRNNFLEPEVYHLNPTKSDTELFRNLVRFLPSAISWYGAYLFKAFPLDMSQYTSLFNATRIPKPGLDVLFKDETAKHVLVMRRGNFYVFDVLDENGAIREPRVLRDCLKYILEEKSPENPNPLGILTTENRDIWAGLRKHVEDSSPLAKSGLRLIDSAVFAINLDDEAAKDDIQLAHQMLHGDGANRWFDKSFSLIFAKDGTTSVNFEHSWGDGVAVMRFINEVLKDSINRPCLSAGDTTASGVDVTKEVRKLDIPLDAKLNEGIREATKKFHFFTSSLGINILRYNKLGKNSVKKQKLSPDAIMQLGFQMAYYRLAGKSAASYESCSTAAFRRGRTETIRPATVETAACSQAFLHKDQFSAAHLRALIEKSSNKHGQLTKDAAMGQGFDRHLFALRYLAEKKGKTLPSIYTDPAYAQINHNIISTSTLASPAVMAGGFGPVVKDGYGIGYGIQDDECGCIVTTYPPHADGAAYVEALRRSFDDIVDVFTKTAKS